MPQGVISVQFTNDPVLPLYGEKEALELPIQLAPGKQFVAGTVLGQITGSANDVQTVAVSGTPTGGSFTLTGTNPLTGQSFTTAAIAYNAAASAVQTALVAVFGSGNVACTGGALPGSNVTCTFGGALANVPVPVMAQGTNSLTGGSTPAASVTHSTVGRTANTFDAYASGNSDGTQVAKCVLKYSCTTDTSGRIVIGTVPTGSAYPNVSGFWGEQKADAPAYFRGTFAASQLTGLDSTALGQAGWSVYIGSTSAPVVVRKA